MRFLSSKRFLLLFLIILEIIFIVRGTLNTRTVKNWTALVENYLLKLAEDGLKTHELQELYDGANYTVEEKNGSDTLNSVKSRLGDYFVKKETTAKVGLCLSWHGKLYVPKL